MGLHALRKGFWNQVCISSSTLNRTCLTNCIRQKQTLRALIVQTSCAPSRIKLPKNLSRAKKHRPISLVEPPYTGKPVQVGRDKTNITIARNHNSEHSERNTSKILKDWGWLSQTYELSCTLNSELACWPRCRSERRMGKNR